MIDLPDTLTLNVRGDTLICVPASLEQLTTYVLLEQEDWFEDEIRFLRRWLRPGMQAVDVGASFGVYATAIAKAVGPGGRVWAFEPTPDTANFLQRTIELNHLDQIIVVRKALADRAGDVSLIMNAHSEINAIELDGPSGRDCVTVPCTTLDRAAAEHGWSRVDFVKLDVEGAELEVVLGGLEFLAASMPLVMFEIKTEVVDLRVLEPLAAMGYEFYRLLPGMLVLAPFDSQQPVDRFQINLFACKPERAAELAASGLLVNDGEAPAGKVAAEAWEAYARNTPYSRGLAKLWRSNASFFVKADVKSYFAGLAAFAESCRPDHGAAAKLGLVTRAFERVAESLESSNALARKISYARLAFELGARDAAVNALDEVACRLAKMEPPLLNEPFLAPSSRYEKIAAGDSPHEWLKCAVLDQLEKLRAFSSLLTGTSALDALAPIAESALRLPEMERRRQLVRMRAGLQRAPEAVPLLAHRSEQNLNPAFWRGAGLQKPETVRATMFPIASVPLDLLPRIKIVDVGAMSLGEGTDCYAQLIRTVPCEVVGFEPVAAECEKLNRDAKPGYRYLPYAIGDGSEQTFHECNFPMTSSLYEPNTELLKNFEQIEDFMRVIATRRVVTHRLDDLPEARDADYLKLDVQGAELMVLRGAVKTLEKVLVVHTEAEFIEIYKKQPLFADLDGFLRAHGFVLHKFPSLNALPFRTSLAEKFPGGKTSQLMWCDVVYVRDFLYFERLSPPQLLKLAAILHQNYASHDLVALALQAYDARKNSGLQASYLQSLGPA